MWINAAVEGLQGFSDINPLSLSLSVSSQDSYPYEAAVRKHLCLCAFIPAPLFRFYTLFLLSLRRWRQMVFRREMKFSRSSSLYCGLGRLGRDALKISSAVQRQYSRNFRAPLIHPSRWCMPGHNPPFNNRLLFNSWAWIWIESVTSHRPLNWMTGRGMYWITIGI